MMFIIESVVLKMLYLKTFSPVFYWALASAVGLCVFVPISLIGSKIDHHTRRVANIYFAANFIIMSTIVGDWLFQTLMGVLANGN